MENFDAPAEVCRPEFVGQKSRESRVGVNGDVSAEGVGAGVMAGENIDIVCVFVFLWWVRECCVRMYVCVYVCEAQWLAGCCWRLNQTPTNPPSLNYDAKFHRQGLQGR